MRSKTFEAMMAAHAAQEEAERVMDAAAAALIAVRREIDVHGLTSEREAALESARKAMGEAVAAYAMTEDEFILCYEQNERALSAARLRTA